MFHPLTIQSSAPHLCVFVTKDGRRFSGELLSLAHRVELPVSYRTRNGRATFDLTDRQGPWWHYQQRTGRQEPRLSRVPESWCELP